MQKAKQHPAGLTGLATTVLIWAAMEAGLEIPADIAAAIVGLAAGIVSYFTPR